MQARIRVGDNELDVNGTRLRINRCVRRRLGEALNEPLNVSELGYALNEGKEAQAIRIHAVTDEKTNPCWCRHQPEHHDTFSRSSRPSTITWRQ